VTVKQTIFYIDDDAGCLNLFQETFGGENDVRTATTLGEARRMLAERPADIVISDQAMPEITGTDFLSEVAMTYPASYRVLLTGSIGFAQVIPEIGTGIIHFFAPKPWTQQDMRQMLERAIMRFDRFDKVRQALPKRYNHEKVLS
jgi:DNA-binding NtrC family response regulator